APHAVLADVSLARHLRRSRDRGDGGRRGVRRRHRDEPHRGRVVAWIRVILRPGLRPARLWLWAPLRRRRPVRLTGFRHRLASLAELRSAPIRACELTWAMAFWGHYVDNLARNSQPTGGDCPCRRCPRRPPALSRLRWAVQVPSAPTKRPTRSSPTSSRGSAA